MSFTEDEETEEIDLDDLLETMLATSDFFESENEPEPKNNLSEKLMEAPNLQRFLSDVNTDFLGTEIYEGDDIFVGPGRRYEARESEYKGPYEMPRKSSTDHVQHSYCFKDGPNPKQKIDYNEVNYLENRISRLDQLRDVDLLHERTRSLDAN